MALQKKNVKCAREVAILAPYAAKCCVRDDISNMPSFTACIEYALERVESYEEQYGKIDFYALMGMPLAVFDVPASFDGTTRYEASLFGSEAFFLKLFAPRSQSSISRACAWCIPISRCEPCCAHCMPSNIVNATASTASSTACHN